MHAGIARMCSTAVACSTHCRGMVWSGCACRIETMEEPDLWLNRSKVSMTHPHVSSVLPRLLSISNQHISSFELLLETIFKAKYCMHRQI
jgi:hypothetical protein